MILYSVVSSIYPMAAVVATLAACGGKEARTCEPGRQVQCACPGGSRGAQACLANGRGYASCQCGAGEPASSTTKAPPATTPPSAAPSVDAGTTAADGPQRWTASDLVPCPADAIALASRLARWSAEDAREEIESTSAKCTAGFFPDPGWVVTMRRGFSYVRLVIDAASRTVIARAEPEGVSGGGGVEVKRLATIDFEGDGVSEVLQDAVFDVHGYVQEDLIVLQMRSHKGQLLRQ